MRTPASTPITIPAMAPPFRPDAAFGLVAAAAAAEGAMVGLASLTFVGLTEGLGVGGRSPFLLGAAVVGLTVGTTDGLGVGIDEGMLLGIDEGMDDGMDDGMLVGLEVS
jgi:hypothetical protein